MPESTNSPVSAPTKTAAPSVTPAGYVSRTKVLRALGGLRDGALFARDEARDPAKKEEHARRATCFKHAAQAVQQLPSEHPPAADQHDLDLVIGEWLALAVASAEDDDHETAHVYLLCASRLARAVGRLEAHPELALFRRLEAEGKSHHVEETLQAIRERRGL